MARVSVRGLTEVHRISPSLGNAMEDLVNHISDLKQTVDAQKQQIAALQKKVK